MKNRLVVLALLSSSLVGCSAPVPLTAAGSTSSLLAASRAGAPRVIVSAPGLTASDLQAMGKRYGLRLVTPMERLGCGVFAIAGASAQDLHRLSKDPAVKYVERDVAGSIHDTARSITEAPSDPMLAEQWDMARMRTVEAWDVRDGASSTVVAILDTGVDLGHPDLAPKLVGGVDILSPGEPPMDDMGHGTATAGIVGAVADNGEGLIGVAPFAGLMPVKVNVPNSGHVRASDAAAGIVWAVDHEANVINMSLGFTEGEDGLTPGGLKTLQRAVSYALEKGVMVVCAAGNISGRPVANYPAAWAAETGFEGLLAVGTTDRGDRRAAYSNYGPWLTVVAPADDVPALSVGGYGRFGGTSAAAPHVSGLAALLITPSRPPSLKTLRDWIVRSARDAGPTGRDPQYGAGVVDALAAVQMSTR